MMIFLRIAIYFDIDALAEPIVTPLIFSISAPPAISALTFDLGTLSMPLGSPHDAARAARRAIRFSREELSFRRRAMTA